VGRGSVAQSAVATLISFAFCALSFREQPFDKPRLNHVKIFSEFQIFGILLVCLIVQVHDQGFDSEIVTIEAYGVMQTTLVIAIVPVILYFFVITFRDLKTEVKDDMDEFSPGRKRYGVQGAHLNPLGIFLRTSIPFIWRILSAAIA